MKRWVDENGNHWCDASSVDECLCMIRDIGFDYDGLGGSVESLKYLVDELIDYAERARTMLYEGKLWAKESMGGERPKDWKEVYE